MEERTNLGIIIFDPIKEAIEVANIGPKNHASGIFNNSAAKELGMDIAIINRNSFENICLKLSLLNGRAWLFCMNYDFRFYRHRKNFILYYFWYF